MPDTIEFGDFVPVPEILASIDDGLLAHSKAGHKRTALTIIVDPWVFACVQAWADERWADKAAEKMVYRGCPIIPGQTQGVPFEITVKVG